MGTSDLMGCMCGSFLVWHLHGKLGETLALADLIFVHWLAPLGLIIRVLSLEEVHLRHDCNLFDDVTNALEHLLVETVLLVKVCSLLSTWMYARCRGKPLWQETP